MVKQRIIEKKIYFILPLLLFVVIGLILVVASKKHGGFQDGAANIINDSREVFTSDQNISIVTTGDIGLVRDINYKILVNKNPNYPFLNIADYLRNADLTLINLEGPLIKDCPIILEGFTFCGESSNVAGLTFAGIDGANLANNHTTNYGLDGLNQTENDLESSNIAAFGLENKIRYIKIKNKNIALVGFIELGSNWGGLSNATVENIIKLNREAKNNADIIINAFHWGVEYTYIPTDNQILLAHTAIDSGADIVLGNHPHYIQPIEKYKNKYIIYAQGNTIFDQDWSQETREGVLYKFLYRNGVFEKVDEKYTIIENNSQPRFATDTEMKLIKEKVSGN